MFELYGLKFVKFLSSELFVLQHENKVNMVYRYELYLNQMGEQLDMFFVRSVRDFFVKG